MRVLEEIGTSIDQFDEKLTIDRRLLSHSTLYSIYRLKHDLLHLKILFNPLKEIISRLQRTTQDDRLLFPRTNPSHHLDINHRMIRRQTKPLRSVARLTNSLMNKKTDSRAQSRKSSIYFNEKIYVCLNDLNDHIDQLLDSLEIQRESVANLISFWLVLNNNQIEEILKVLMLISVLFMPCVFLTGVNSLNFVIEPQRTSDYGYFIVLGLLGAIIFGMVTWYKVKQWI